VFTTQEVADRFGVAYETAVLWLRQGRLKGAVKRDYPRGPVWEVPASALQSFERPRMGRPTKAKAKASKKRR